MAKKKNKEPFEVRPIEYEGFEAYWYDFPPDMQFVDILRQIADNIERDVPIGQEIYGLDFEERKLFYPDLTMEPDVQEPMGLRFVYRIKASQQAI